MLTTCHGGRRYLSGVFYVPREYWSAPSLTLGEARPLRLWLPWGEQTSRLCRDAHLKVRHGEEPDSHGQIDLRRL